MRHWTRALVAATLLVSLSGGMQRVQAEGLDLERINLFEWKNVIAAVESGSAALDELDRAKDRERNAGERQSTHKDLGIVVEIALGGPSAEPDKPWPVFAARLESLLAIASHYPPSSDSIAVMDVFATRVPRAIQASRTEEREDYRALLLKYWAVESRKAGEKSKSFTERNVVARQLLIETLGSVVRTVPKEEIYQFRDVIVELLASEASWIRDLGNDEPMSVNRAVSILATQPDSPTLRPLLRALHSLDRAAYDQLEAEVVNATLFPVVPALLELIRKLEIRTDKGENLHASYTSQFSAWFDTMELLRLWTKQKKIVWYVEWNDFWTAHDGATGERFDFTAARPVDDDDEWDEDDEQTGIAGEDEAGIPTPEIFGVEVKTSKFLIIVDCSGSMRKPGGVDRLTKLQKHTKEFVASLKQGTIFNILPFGSTSSMKDSMARTVAKKDFVAKMSAPKKANHKTDKKVLRWIDQLSATGYTNVAAAFQEAFRKPARARKRDGWRPVFEEIFFITDGSPTDGGGQPLQDHTGLLAQIRALNLPYKIPIRCIGFSGADRSFISELQRQNYGGDKTTIID